MSHSFEHKSCEVELHRIGIGEVSLPNSCPENWSHFAQRMDLRREEQFESEMFMELKRFCSSRSSLELQQVFPE